MITQGNTEHDSITFDLNLPNTSKDSMVNMNVNVHDMQFLLSEPSGK